AFALRNGEVRIRRAGEALTIYFLICTAMPFAGAYPVPLVGMGMSSILGAWLAVGLLACCVITPSSPASRQKAAIRRVWSAALARCPCDGAGEGDHRLCPRDSP